MMLAAKSDRLHVSARLTATRGVLRRLYNGVGNKKLAVMPSVFCSQVTHKLLRRTERALASDHGDPVLAGLSVSMYIPLPASLRLSQFSFLCGANGQPLVVPLRLPVVRCNVVACEPCTVQCTVDRTVPCSQSTMSSPLIIP
jgi:hypothetical protein